MDVAVAIAIGMGDFRGTSLNDEFLSHWMLILSPKSSNWYNESVSTSVEHSDPFIPSSCSNTHIVVAASFRNLHL